MNYKKVDIKNYKSLGMYPVYVDKIYNGKEPFTIVGIREDQVEIEGDFSGGTHNFNQKDWVKDDSVFVLKEVCTESLKPNGCQVRNVYCCGGGSVVKRHIDKYWENMINEQLNSK